MEVFLIRVLQFILAISLLVLLHEGGHFFFSKLFGVRVEKFYVFFDWKFSLFKFKPRYWLAAIRRLLQDSRYDRRKFRYRTDETTRTALGISC